MITGYHVQVEVLDGLEDGEQLLVSRTENDARADNGGGDLVGKGQGLLLTRQLAAAVEADRFGSVRFHPDLPPPCGAHGGDGRNEDQLRRRPLVRASLSYFFGTLPVHVQHFLVAQGRRHSRQMKDRTRSVHAFFQELRFMQPTIDQLRTGLLQEAGLGILADQAADSLSARPKGLHQMRPDKPATAGDEYK